MNGGCQGENVTATDEQVGKRGDHDMVVQAKEHTFAHNHTRSHVLKDAFTSHCLTHTPL